MWYYEINKKHNSASVFGTCVKHPGFLCHRSRHPWHSPLFINNSFQWQKYVISHYPTHSMEESENLNSWSFFFLLYIQFKYIYIYMNLETEITCVCSHGLLERSSAQSVSWATEANWHFATAVPLGRFLLIRSLPEASRMALADIFCHSLTHHTQLKTLISKSITERSSVSR